ncbi:hypothetical protein [Streptomyces sp. NPDC002758]
MLRGPARGAKPKALAQHSSTWITVVIVVAVVVLIALGIAFLP